MTETIRQLIARKSIRAFQDREISQEDKQLILEASVNAPTAGCQQLYTIIDITDQQIKEKLVDTCDHQPFIAKAAMVLIFAADCRKWYDAFAAAGCNPREPGVGDLVLAVTDASIAAQNAVIAAESLGISSCYIGDIMENYEAQRELLQLPEYVFPACMIVFGYAAENTENIHKPKRAEMKYVVHENGYHKMNGEELQQMLAYKAGQLSYEEWISRFCKRKYNSDFSKEMTRSVGEYIKQFDK